MSTSNSNGSSDLGLILGVVGEVNASTFRGGIKLKSKQIILTLRKTLEQGTSLPLKTRNKSTLTSLPPDCCRISGCMPQTFRLNLHRRQGRATCLPSPNLSLQECRSVLMNKSHRVPDTLISRMREVQALIPEINKLESEGRAWSEANGERIRSLQQRVAQLSRADSGAGNSSSEGADRGTDTTSEPSSGPPPYFPPVP
ncbi:hypothetical protein CPC08DRAFT_396406 [Agrocybe pediades]|nr:hypothetical protein CPC08DRAFT_396406 [Agrocybe pediades]